MPKPTIGQGLYLVFSSGYGASKGQSCEVVKVGRKYFEVRQNKTTKYTSQFHLEDWREKSEYTPRYRIYESEQHYLDEIERDKLHRCIQEKFHYRYNNKFTLQQLREAARALNINENITSK